MKSRLTIIISVLLLVCGAAANSFAATLQVTKTADTADGVCDIDCSLREAVSAANGGDTIVFSPLFNAAQIILLTSGQITINKSLTIAGPGAGLLTVSGNNAARIFHISNNAAVTLTGITLKDGFAKAANDYYGGAIYLIGSTLTLTNVVLSNNTARYTNPNPPVSYGSGGAIYSENSSLSVVNSRMSNNSAEFSGGIYSLAGVVNISGSTISNNIRGGVFNGERGLINVVNSVFNGNAGSPVATSNGRLSVINSIVTNNGGGIVNSDSQGTLAIDRSIISNNEQSNSAGESAAAFPIKEQLQSATRQSVITMSAEKAAGFLMSAR